MVAEERGNERARVDAQLSRRTTLRAAGAGIVGAVGVRTATADTQSATGPVVYIDRTAGIAAVDAETGDVCWNEDLGFEAITEPLTVADGVIYGLDQTSIRHREAFAVDAATAEVLWTYDGIDAWVGVGPTVVGDTFYAAAEDGSVHAIDRHEGELRWREAVGDGLNPGLTVSYGTVFVSDGRAIAVDAADGSIRWRSSDDTHDHRGNPAIAGRRVCYGTDDGIVALDVVDGSLDWATDVPGGSSFEEVVFDGTRLYAGDLGEGLVTALDPRDGEVRWTYDDHGQRTVDAPTVAEGVVFVSTFDFYEDSVGLHAVDATDGTHRWSVEATTDLFWSAPTVYDGVVYVGDHQGQVSAFDATSGDRRWRAPVHEHWLSTPPMVVEDPQNGSGVGSRGRLGAQAHHDEAIHYSRSLPESVEFSAAFTTAPSAPTIGEDVVLHAGRSQPATFIEEYTWQLDGTALDEDGRRIEHVIDDPGLHEVRLRVVGPGGRTASRTDSVAIRGAEPTVASYADVETGRVSREGVEIARQDREAGRTASDTYAAVLWAWLHGLQVH